jgi:hypothetical protein
MSAMRRIALSAMAAAVGLCLAAAPASAHSVSGVSATNFHTNLKSVTPDRPGLEVDVVEAGSRLQVENRTGTELVVLGYKDEPYLRIGPDGVFQNKLSTATYINASREGQDPPDSAKNAKVGDTDWEKISSEPVARWHDHRIHWMLPTDPSPVQANPDQRHVIIPEWVVTMKTYRGTPPDPREGDETFTVKGDLVWVPGPSALPWFAFVAALVALVIVIGRRPNWATGLAAVTAVLVAVDMFHALGLGLANTGDLGERLAKSVTQAPLALLDWAAGALAIVWLLRRRPGGRGVSPRQGRREPSQADGLTVAVLAGLLVALLGGVSDVSSLSRSEVPFGFGAGLARLTVAASLGLGFGLAVAAALRLAGVWRPFRPETQASADPVTAPV